MTFSLKFGFSCDAVDNFVGNLMPISVKSLTATAGSTRGLERQQVVFTWEDINQNQSTAANFALFFSM